MKSDALKNKIKIAEIENQLNICDCNTNHLEFMLTEFMSLTEWVKLEMSTIEDVITKTNKKIFEQTENKFLLHKELIKYKTPSLES